jgi:TDG/mug DNA glycosylase family protein
METLADYLDYDLRIISVGLNPSLPSIRDGYYFSGVRNRFWPGLNRSKLLQSSLEPSVESMQIMLKRDRIGFTDTVKRPTAGAGGLNAADFREWVPILEEKLIQYQARVIWFHGMVAYKNYLKYAATIPPEDVSWGLQNEKIGSSKIFVAPNPSPANAVYTLDDLVDWFDRLNNLSG